MNDINISDDIKYIDISERIERKMWTGVKDSSAVEIISTAKVIALLLWLNTTYASGRVRQSEIAEFCGFSSVSAMSKILSGNTATCCMTTILIMAEFLDVNLSTVTKFLKTVDVSTFAVPESSRKRTSKKDKNDLSSLTGILKAPNV